MDAATQQGAAMAAIGLAGTVAGLFFGWLKDRDKYRYDIDMANVKAQNTTQAAQIEALKRENAECKEHSAKQDERLNKLEAAVAKPLT